MRPELTEKAAQQMEKRFALEKEAIEILAVIATEFETDPMSVQCFDLRIVERAKTVTKDLRSLKGFF